MYVILNCVLCNNVIQFAQGSGLPQKNNIVYIGKYKVSAFEMNGLYTLSHQ